MIRAALTHIVAQAQAVATSEARRAGIAHARAKDPGSYRGRKPTFTRSQFDAEVAMLGKGSEGVSAIANATGLSRQAVYRIRDERADMEAALAACGV
jgi:putative DNA-invertase from lambdoid prophage Rac